MIVPDWLKQRGGDLRPGSDGQTWYVLLEGKPQYSLVPIPASGKYACVFRQTTNGKRMESTGAFASEDEALQGCLADLRKSLGW